MKVCMHMSTTKCHDEVSYGQLSYTPSQPSTFAFSPLVLQIHLIVEIIDIFNYGWLIVLKMWHHIVMLLVSVPNLLNLHKNIQSSDEFKPKTWNAVPVGIQGSGKNRIPSREVAVDGRILQIWAWAWAWLLPTTSNIRRIRMFWSSNRVPALGNFNILWVGKAWSRWRRKRRTDEHGISILRAEDVSVHI